VGIAPESAFIAQLFPKFGHIRSFDERTLSRFEMVLNSPEIDIENFWKVPASALMQPREDFLGRSYAEACAQIYRNFHSVRGLGPVDMWGDKNNAYGNYLNVLSFLFPSARFIHLVRDGRAVFNSYKKLATKPEHKYAPVLPKTAKSVALRWVDTVSRIDRHLSRFAPGRHLAVRYEDVLGDFESTIGRVCAFLGLEYESRMREFDQLNRRYELEPREYGWKKNTFKPLDPDKAISWRTELAMQEVKIFEREAAHMLTRYNYPLVSGIAANEKPVWLTPALLKGRIREGARSVRFHVVKARAKMGL